MNRALLAALLSFTLVAHAQDEGADNETSWLKNSAKEGAVLKTAAGVPSYLVRVAGGAQAAPSLLVDCPSGGRVVVLTPARETTLARVPADRAVRVTFGQWKVLQIAVFDENEQKLFDGAVARPHARVYLNVRPGWDEARCAKALDVLSLLARASAGNEEAMGAARNLAAQQDDRIAAALLQEIVGGGVPAPPDAPAPTACSDDDIADFLSRLQKSAFDDKRLDQVESHARGSHYYTVDQVVKIAKAFSFGEGRVKAIGMLAPRIVDRKNFARIYDALTFSSEKEQVREIEKKLGPPTGSPTRATDAELTEALSRLEKESFDDGRAKVLESVAASHTFACDQVARIVKTFKFGDGQVKAVKILLPRIVDRENFDKIYDAVTFQSDRDRIKKLEKESR